MLPSGLGTAALVLLKGRVSRLKNWVSLLGDLRSVCFGWHKMQLMHLKVGDDPQLLFCWGRLEIII